MAICSEATANILNKQSPTPDKGWSSSFGVGRGATNSLPQKITMLRNIHNCLGLGPILWYKAMKKGHEIMWRRTGTGGGLLCMR